MRACKTSGGLKGGRFRNKESSHKMWCSTLNHFADVSESISLMIHPKSDVTVDHKDLSPAIMKKDFNAVKNIIDWLDDNNPFDDNRNSELLVSFTTGHMSCKGKDEINPENAEEIGRLIQETLDNKCFLDPIQMKLKVKPLSHLKKGMKIKEKDIVLHSLKLFNRLIIISEREIKIEDSLAFELTPLPLCFFQEDQCMRKPNKSLLGNYLKSLVDTPDCIDVDITIIDGGSLLYKIPWEIGKSYGDISISYLRYVKSLGYKGQIIVVFDGYNNSPKDHEHNRRSNRSCNDIEVTSNKINIVKKSKMLDNKHNKSGIIKLLMDVFSSNGIMVKQANDDADTLIVKTAVECSQRNQVNVEVDDTDILVMLIHHISEMKQPIYLTTSDKRNFQIDKVYNSLLDVQRKNLLFSHSFSGCDTVSAIFGAGKVMFFKKIYSVNADGLGLQEEIDVFYSPNSSKEQITSSGIKIFQFLYNSKSADKSLPRLRYTNFTKMTAKGIIRPERLPPTEGAVTQHSLRAYLQLQDWLSLTSMSLDPTNFGWSKTDNTFETIGSLSPIAPKELEKFISCGCKIGKPTTPCSNNRCSCRKNGLNCISACSECHGLNCANGSNEIIYEEE